MYANSRTGLDKLNLNVVFYPPISCNMMYFAGVTAALELALVSKDLTNMEKLDFVRRKVEFMQEFGDVAR